MKFSVSNSCFVADSFAAMVDLPSEFGIEIQIEFGTDFYWKTNLAKVMKDRTGALSIHGQFVDIDLAAADLNEQEIYDYYRWGFDMYNKYHAEHFVIHPDGKLCAPATAEQIAEMRKRSICRIGRLSEIAKEQGVSLLVENIRSKGYGMVFDSEAFIDLFRQLPDVNCLIDTGHMNLSGWDFTHVISSLSDRILSYHINDNDGIADSHQPVGNGNINWESFFATYQQYTPNAEMVLEYKGATVPQIVANADMIRQMLK